MILNSRLTEYNVYREPQMTSAVVREIFQIVNEESEEYQLLFLENPPASNTSYTPHRLMKTVCRLVSEGARIMVSSRGVESE